MSTRVGYNKSHKVNECLRTFLINILLRTYFSFLKYISRIKPGVKFTPYLAPASLAASRIKLMNRSLKPLSLITPALTYGIYLLV